MLLNKREFIKVEINALLGNILTVLLTVLYLNVREYQR